MMRTGKLMLMLVLLIPAAIIAGCLGNTEQEGDLEFTDPLGRAVILEDYPVRIATLSPALTETVFALGIGDRVVATDNVSNYPASASSLPKVFGFTGLMKEDLVITEPDLVIMDKTLDISENAYNSIRSLGIPVYRIYPRTTQDVLEAILGIGNITGTEDEAEAIVDDFRSRMEIMDSYLEDIDEEDKPGILLVTYYDGGFDPWVATDSTMAGGLIETAGGVNVISDGTGIVVQVSVETVIGADPDIIICTQSTVWPTETRDTILSDDRWKDITAVKENKVFDINGDLVDRTGPRLIDGLEAIHSHVSDHIEE
jgi:iron complex transport system substrate-binding protein